MRLRHELAAKLAGGASRRQFHSLCCTLASALLLLVPNSQALPLRVTSWNLLPPAARTNASGAITNGISLPAVAAVLKKLDPDVILLQQVTDWAMCDELARAFKPATYNVVVCSAFRDGRSGALRKQQVAILAKRKARAYFSWSEPWRSRPAPTLPGGFAFAAFQVGTQRIGLFSVQVGSPPAPATNAQQSATSPEERLTATLGQLLAQVGSVSNWVTNRVDTFVVGSTFALPAGRQTALEDTPLQLLQDAGFGDAFQDLSAKERATQPGKSKQPGAVGDYLFTRPADAAANPGVTRISLSRRFPITCDVNLGPPTGIAAETVPAKPAPVPVRKAQAVPSQTAQATVLSKPIETVSSSHSTEPSPSQIQGPALASPQASTRSKLPLLWLTAALVAIIALATIVWAIKRRVMAPSPSSSLLAANGDAPSGYTVVLTSSSATPDDQPPHPSRPLIHMETPGTTHTQTELLRQRALAAEQQAERAHAVIRAGLIPHLGHWLKQKLVRKLIADRTQLLETQQAAANRAQAVEQRLARVERQIQQQNQFYLERIEALTRELLVAKDENRELIQARITQVKAQMADARARLLAQSQAGRDAGV